MTNKVEMTQSKACAATAEIWWVGGRLHIALDWQTRGEGATDRGEHFGRFFYSINTSISYKKWRTDWLTDWRWGFQNKSTACLLVLSCVIFFTYLFFFSSAKVLPTQKYSLKNMKTSSFYLWIFSRARLLWDLFIYFKPCSYGAIGPHSWCKLSNVDDL